MAEAPDVTGGSVDDSDAPLAAGLRQRDPRAQDELCARFGRPLQRFIANSLKAASG